MFWESMTLMTIIDITIFVFISLAFHTFYKQRDILKQLNLQIGSGLILLGLGIISSFYFVDLLVMHAFPLFMPAMKAMAIMESLHLNYSWPVMLFGCGFLSLGFYYLVKVLFPNVARAFDLTTKAQENAEKRSETDCLTGLFNRLKLDETFSHELERSKRYGHPLSLILFDIDYFKKVNDTFGHQVGDDVLVSFAKMTLENIRTIDIAGRWGGEEFMILCPETSIDGAVLLAEKLRAAFESFIFPEVGQLTASFGVASTSSGGDEKLITCCADEALYLAKTNGRNCVETSSSGFS